MGALVIDPVGPDDSSLVAAFVAGDESAAGVLVRRHSAAMARFVYGLGAPSADVDDLLQEAFFRAFRSIATFRGDSSFRGWLFRIAANAARDHHRRGRKRGVVLTLEDRELADTADPVGEAEASEAEGRLNLALGQLPPKQREVFLLRAQQGMAYEDIAESLGTSPGAARVHYHHAVKRLKEAMA
jgi:RNA polymerase sigma-70 factor (ECF subfamily)